MYRVTSPSEPALASPPRTPPRGHKQTLSKKGISWLSRGSSSSSSSTFHSKQIRISEPKFTNMLEIYAAPRSGILGSGAIVVKTPQEALSAQFHHEQETDDYDIHIHSEIAEVEEYGGEEDDFRKLPSTPPKSPDLPPIPFEQELRKPVAATRPTPPPSLKTRSSESLVSVPALPPHITASPLPPRFNPILVGPPPSSAIDPSKIIVALETGTSTHRTTLTTLTSRPSHLATYLTSLLPRPDSGASIYSPMSAVSSTPESSFNSIFHQHLASSGLLSQASSSIHVFLDRPSAPYAHIMTYLRTPPSTPSNPATLPRAIQLISSSSARLEALLELRDEARFLALDELYVLCAAEILHSKPSPTRPASRHSHVRANSSSAESVHSTTHTYREPERKHDHERAPSAVSHVSAPTIAARRDSLVSHISHKSAPVPLPPLPSPAVRDSVATTCSDYGDEEDEDIEFVSLPPPPPPPPARAAPPPPKPQSQPPRRSQESHAPAFTTGPRSLRASPPPGWI